MTESSLCFTSTGSATKTGPDLVSPRQGSCPGRQTPGRAVPRGTSDHLLSQDCGETATVEIGLLLAHDNVCLLGSCPLDLVTFPERKPRGWDRTGYGIQQAALLP